MKYIYSAVFTPGDNGKWYARIPDLPSCITTGSSLHDAIVQITDAASCYLVVAEDEGLPIAEAAPQSSVPHESTDTLSLIQIDTIAYRATTETKAVRKNVSLPAWMADLADRRGINCSQLLQESLMEKFA